MDKNNQHSVYNEPHLNNQHHKLDPSDTKVDKIFDHKESTIDSEDQLIEHSVWDEPSLSDELKNSTDNQHLTYSGWLKHKASTISWSKSWLITLAVILCAGTWAIIGSILNPLSGGELTLSLAVIAITLIAPMTEEFMKIAIPLYIVEKRPFYFKSRLQVLLCVVAGGIVFAIIENLLYIYIYIPNPSQELIIWRWTICTLMHTGATLISGMGLMQIWATSEKNQQRPQLHLAYPYIITAITLHAAYNFFAIILSQKGFF